MDIQQELAREHSKAHTLYIADRINNDTDQFAVLMSFYLGEDKLLAQRAAWVFTHCVESYPHLALPYIDPLIDILDLPVHDALKRNALRSFEFVKIPEPFHGRLIDVCFRIVMDRKEAAANRAFSITILDQLTQHYPDLRHELIEVLEMEFDQSTAAFKSRARKVLGK